MRKLIALALACATLSSFGQCVPEMDGTDPVTKERVLVYRTKPQVNGWFVSTAGRLHLQFRMWTTSAQTMADGAPVSIRFTDDSSLDLHHEGEKTSTAAGIGGWSLDTHIPLDLKQLALLATKTARTVRLGCRDGNVDKELPPLHLENFQQTAKCLYEAVRAK